MGKYIKISSYDIYLAYDYLEKNNSNNNQIKEQLEYYTNKLEDNGYIKINYDNPIIKLVLKAYKSELNLQMIQNSLLWSIINIKNDKKNELELLYKTVMLEKLKMINKWDNKKENKLILKLLKDNQELYEYIIFTQNMDEYIEDIECKEQIEKKLTKHLNNR